VSEQHDGDAVSFPKVLAARQDVPQVADVLTRETSLFRARQETRAAKKSLLLQQIKELKSQISGSQAHSRPGKSRSQSSSESSPAFANCTRRAMSPLPGSILEREAERPWQEPTSSKQRSRQRLQVPVGSFA